jgi:hypothetical protein
MTYTIQGDNSGMSANDVQKIAGNLKLLNAAEDRKCSDRRAQAQRSGQRAAQSIGSADPAILRVWGFGSTWETWRNYRMDSDIDLGLEGGDWSRAVSSLWNGPSARQYEFSLVSLDEQPQTFSDLVKKNGVILYEKKQ